MKPKLKPGWRWLKNGETVKKGDLWEEGFPCQAIIGTIYGAGFGAGIMRKIEKKGTK